MTLALSIVRGAAVETGVDTDLRRDDASNRPEPRRNSTVIPAKAGTHASFNERSGAVWCGDCRTLSSRRERVVF
jgi:hypothetical protein